LKKYYFLIFLKKEKEKKGAGAEQALVFYSAMQTL